MRDRKQAFATRLVAALFAVVGAACSGNERTDGGEHAPSTRVRSTEAQLTADFVAAPGGARVVLARQYVRTVEDLLGPEAAGEAVPPNDPKSGGIDSIAARTLPIVPTAVLQAEVSAFAVAEAAVEHPDRLVELARCVRAFLPRHHGRHFLGPSHSHDFGPHHPHGRSHRVAKHDERLRAACYAMVAERLGSVAFRRPLTTDEKTRLVAIARLAEEEGLASGRHAQRHRCRPHGGPKGDQRFRTGLIFLVATILESPSFLYSIEVGTPPASGDNRTLTAAELATRMSLLLLGRAPSADLLARASAGDLDSEAGVRAVATDLLQTQEARVGFRDQVEQMFELRQLPSKAKDATLFPNFGILRDSMAEEIFRFTEDFVFDNRRSFLGMLTDETRFVDQNLATLLYGVTVANDWDPVDFSVPALAQQQRAGILSMPGLMAILSHPTQNSPTRRGIFVRDRVLCLPGNPPPMNFMPPPPTVGVTLRQQMEVHGTCGPQCHGKMDPLGFPFELFDAIGAFRTQDNGIDVDLTGSYDFDDDGPEGFTSLNGSTGTGGPRPLAAVLVTRPEVPRCWVIQFYRAGIGLKEQLGPQSQESALDDLTLAFSTVGYDVQSLLIELTASPAFTQVGPLR